VSIFFTGNGILIGQFFLSGNWACFLYCTAGKQIPINPTADCLYPLVKMGDYADMSLETNFGDDPAKSFKYDIEKCPGLGLQ
jgi:hypothetical protein